MNIAGDIWSENGAALFAVLLHWVGPDWKMHTRLVSCVPFSKFAHTADNISTFTKERLSSIGLGPVDSVMKNVFAKVPSVCCCCLLSVTVAC